MSAHLTYLEAVVTGLVQGVTELFPVSSLGHNVLLPALIGGRWANDLSVSAPNSPYLAFIVGLHVATAIAMIAYFWRDWLRIVRGFISSIAHRRVETPDERLAWMIILATIPVGIVGLLLQKEFTKVFARPELAALFLAINGVILLVSERMRRARNSRGPGAAEAAEAYGHLGAAGRHAAPAGGPGYGGPGYGGPGYGRPEYGGPEYPYPQPPQGYQQQPRQQQWQGPGYGDDDWRRGQYGQDRPGQYGPGQPGEYGPGQFQQDQYGPPGRHGRPEQYGQEPYGQEPYGQEPYRQDQHQPEQYGRRPARHGHPDQYGPGPYQQDAWAGQQPPGQGAWRGEPDRRAAGVRAAGGGSETDRAVAADRRLSASGYKRAVLVGAAQILALLPGISRDGIVTVAGMWRGLSREDAVRFSFLLSAPVILAAGALKVHDLTGPMGKGIHGPVLVGSLIAGIGAYVSIRFLTRYFSENKSLNPFGIYCLIAGLGSLAYLVLK